MGGDKLKKRGFFILKILITVVSFIVLVVAKSNIDWSNLQNTYIDFSLVKEIVYDLAVGVFSAMILVWFIDEISNRIQEHQSQEKEKASIKRFDKVLQRYIDQYITLFYCVATPLQDRKFDNVEMPEQFTLKDMCDLHQTSTLIQEKFSSGSVEPFLQIELDLRKEFISLVERNEFEYYPQFADIFLSYIQISLHYDSRSAILDAPNRTIGNKKLTDFIHDLLENNADDYYQKMLNGENISANLAHPYIFLYEMMKEERKLILQYQDEIKKLV